jgi:hypothetical protein
MQTHAAVAPRTCHVAMLAHDGGYAHHGTTAGCNHIGQQGACKDVAAGPVETIDSIFL